MLDKRFGPGGQLGLRVGRDVGQGSEGDRVCPLHGFPDQRFFGPELAEDGDLVDPGSIGDAPRGSAAKAKLREHLAGGVDNFVSAVHGTDIYGGRCRNASSHLLTTTVSTVLYRLGRGDLAKVQDLEVAFEAALTHV